MDNFWIAGGRLVTPSGIRDGALHIARGRITAIEGRAPVGARQRNVRGSYVAPGFVDLHVWGDPSTVTREAVRFGTTAFLTTLGPEPASALVRDVSNRAATTDGRGARCLGLHLEGPFLNPIRGGALPRRWMRAPTVRELERVWRASRSQVKLITIAPELSGANAAIRWCQRHGVTVSLGHSDADARQALQAVQAGARAATHVFNGMRSLHHRDAGLLGVALTDSRLTTMVIADGIHVGSTALRLLVRAKGCSRIALVTDSVRHQAGAWQLRKRQGAYYTRDGTLAGSCLTMVDAVKQMVRLGGVSLREAVQMASATPARLLGERSCGTLGQGTRADLVVFDQRFQVKMTIVNGIVVYQRGR